MLLVQSSRVNVKCKAYCKSNQEFLKAKKWDILQWPSLTAKDFMKKSVIPKQLIQLIESLLFNHILIA